MPIDVNCPKCSAPIQAPNNLGGKIIKCPRCKERIALPAPPPEPPPAPPAKGAGAPPARPEGAAPVSAGSQVSGAVVPASLFPGARFRISVLDGFRLGVGLVLAGLAVGVVGVGGFWLAGRFSRSVRKEWEQRVDSAVAATTGGDLTMPNDPLPPMPQEIAALRAGKLWHGAKRGAHIIVATHSFLTNPQDLTDIEEYLRAGQWLSYSKNLLYILVDLSGSPGGAEVEYRPAFSLKALMNDGRTVDSADLVKTRKSRPDQSPWESLSAKLRSLEALFDEAAVPAGSKAAFVAFMPEELDLDRIDTVYWHFTASRRIKLQPYKR